MSNATQETSRPNEPDSAARSRQARPPRKTGTRRAAVGIVALSAVLAAGGLGAVRLLGAGSTADAAAGLTPPTTAPSGSGQAGTAAFGMPEVVSSPRAAVLPAHRTPAKKKPRPAVSGSPSVSPSGSAGTPVTGRQPGPVPSYSPSSPPAESGGTDPSAPASAGSAACTNPQYTTSDPSAMWNLAPYFVANDAWGISGYKVSQTLHACSFSNWYVVAAMDNSNGDGHVKTYPNSHRDFDDNPRINSFSSITSTFAETSPGTGIYEDAYDIWLNGIADSGSTEVMIWNDNHGQTPSGSVQGTATIAGRSYTVWRDGTYVAFVATANFTSGDMNLLAFFQYLMSKGWISSSATLGQVDYGAELVSTNGTPATFSFSGFAVNAS